VRETLEDLGHLPHGIVSQNARDVITATLGPLGLGERFGKVVGYQEVGPGRQKPASDGLLACLEALTDLAPGTAFYIGDHPTDTQCVAESRRELAARGLDIDAHLVHAARRGRGQPA